MIGKANPTIVPQEYAEKSFLKQNTAKNQLCRQDFGPRINPWKKCFNPSESPKKQKTAENAIKHVFELKIRPKTGSTDKISVPC